MTLKKTLATIIAAATILTTTPQDADAYRPRRGRTTTTYSEWKTKTDTPEKMDRFLKCQIRYASDKAGKFTDHKGETRDITDDYMQTGIDTYLRGLGDCEDYANLASEYLKSNGYETKIIAFYEKNKLIGHAICAVKEGETWSYIGNDGYTKGYKTIEDLVVKNSKDWGMYQELNPDQKDPKGMTTTNTHYRDDKQKKFFER